MKKVMSICAMFGALSGAAMAAETWSGTLLDADCTHRHEDRACDAKKSTTAFLLDVNGTKYRLDFNSNDQARSVIDARSDKASNPFATKAVPVTADVTGRLKSNGKIRADIIAVH